MPHVVLLDTNVWVSAFLKPTGPPGQIVGKWQRSDFTVVTSVSQLAEIVEVLSRPRLTVRFKYSAEEVETFVRLIATRAKVVQVSGDFRICRDPDDDEILEAAIRGKAEYLVTRDDDLKRDLDLIKALRQRRVESSPSGNSFAASRDAQSDEHLFTGSSRDHNLPSVRHSQSCAGYR